jgi:hypothetical protein
VIHKIWEYAVDRFELLRRFCELSNIEYSKLDIRPYLSVASHVRCLPKEIAIALEI